MYRKTYTKLRFLFATWFIFWLVLCISFVDFNPAQMCFVILGGEKIIVLLYSKLLISISLEYQGFFPMGKCTQLEMNETYDRFELITLLSCKIELVLILLHLDNWF